ncbi:MAG: CARDB domain-containing protein [Nanoarchaeota archaeon]
MEKQNKAIVAVAVLIVFAALAAPYASPTGFSIATQCSGVPILQFSKDPVLAGQYVIARVSGLTNCEGKEILIKENDGMCNGPVLASFTCRNSVCDSAATLILNTARDYWISACIDKDGDKYYMNSNERAISSLRVLSLPDLSANGLVFPENIYANDPIVAKALISNKGVVTATRFTYSFDVFKENWPTAVYSYTNRASEQSATVLQEVLAPGEAKTLQMPAISLGKGTYRAKFSIDFDNKFAEPDEMNNIVETKFVVN